MNQISMNGPNIPPMNPVPLRCIRKTPIRIATVIGTTAWASDGASTFNPSTALRTEIAGVMAPSPYNSAAPINPMMSKFARHVPDCALRA